MSKNLSIKTPTEEIASNRIAMTSLLRMVTKKMTDIKILPALTRYSVDEMARLINAQRDKTFLHTHFLQDGINNVPAKEDILKMLEHAEGNGTFDGEELPGWLAELVGEDYLTVFPKKKLKKSRAKKAVEKVTAAPEEAAPAAEETVNGVEKPVLDVTIPEENLEELKELKSAFENMKENPEPLAVSTNFDLAPIERDVRRALEMLTKINGAQLEGEGGYEHLSFQLGEVQKKVAETSDKLAAQVSGQTGELHDQVASLSGRVEGISDRMNYFTGIVIGRQNVILNQLAWLKGWMTGENTGEAWPTGPSLDSVAAQETVEEEPAPAEQEVAVTAPVVEKVIAIEEQKEENGHEVVAPAEDDKIYHAGGSAEVKVDAVRPEGLLGADTADDLQKALLEKGLVELKGVATDLGIPGARGMAYKPQVIRAIVSVAFPS